MSDRDLAIRAFYNWHVSIDREIQWRPPKYPRTAPPQSIAGTMSSICHRGTPCDRIGSRPKIGPPNLVFASEDWALLPGPPRSFDLESCFISALRLPDDTVPAANQPEWNGCIRVGGDRLLRCQRGCGDGACETRCVSNYEGCEEACSARFAR